MKFLLVIVNLVVVSGYSAYPGGDCEVTGSAQDAAVAIGNAMGSHGADGTYMVQGATDATDYEPGSVTNIRIVGGSYKGFLLQASAGAFPGTNGGSCANNAMTATHTNANAKTEATDHAWTAPAAGAGDVTFSAIVVNDGVFLTEVFTLTEGAAGPTDEQMDPPDCPACAAAYKAAGGCTATEEEQGGLIPQGCAECQAAAMAICEEGSSAGKLGLGAFSFLAVLLALRW